MHVLPIENTSTLKTKLDFIQCSPREFSNMLTEALYQIKRIEAKSLQIIQDEIGYSLGRNSGTAVTFWRQGNIPAKRSDFQELAKTLMVRAKLDEEWYLKFAKRAGYFEPKNTSRSAVFNLAPNVLLGHVPAVHDWFIGREPIIQQIIKTLEDRNCKRMIGIDGLGGMGKTAIAKQIAQHFQNESSFQHIFWISPESTKTEFTFEAIIDSICNQGGFSELLKLPYEQRLQRIKNILVENTSLLVIDNLETASEPQESIVQKLYAFIDKAKILMTSRRRFVGDLLSIHLTGLTKEESITFLKNDAQQKGISHINQFPETAVDEIMTITGGSPLALKLIISQICYLPLEIILADLKQVISLKNIQNGGEYTEFYRHIFTNIWNVIHENSKMILVTMANFAPNEGCDFLSIQNISAIPIDETKAALNELWKTSLLETSFLEASIHVRYFLHPLTQHFVLSDIAKAFD